MTRREAWTIARALREALPPASAPARVRVTSAGPQLLVRLELDAPPGPVNCLFTAAELDVEPEVEAT